MDALASGRIPTALYRGRVAVLAICFLGAMKENSLHPFPLWSYGITLFLGDQERISDLERRIAILVPLLMYLFSLLMRLSATASIGPGIVWAANARTQLLTQGDLYSLVRHPLYTGSAGMILSLSIMSSIPGALLLSGIGLPFLVFIARYEERQILSEVPAYRTYMYRTPPFLPRRVRFDAFLQSCIRPLKANLGISLRSEAPNIGLFTGFCSFWLTPDLTLFWVAFGIGLLASLTAPLWVRGRTP